MRNNDSLSLVPLVTKRILIFEPNVTEAVLNFTPDLLNFPIIRTRWFEKSGLPCIQFSLSELKRYMMLFLRLRSFGLLILHHFVFLSSDGKAGKKNIKRSHHITGKFSV